MSILPPGTLLQLMHLKARLKKKTPGRFIEVGPGSGEITRILLNLGWTGYSCDLETKTIEGLKHRFPLEISSNKLIPIHNDFLKCTEFENEKVDLILSSMVMEHLDDDDERAFMEKSKYYLKKDGIMIGLVPSSPSHWGIEDDIAGHYRRYTRASLRSLAENHKWKLLTLVGLTYPISNLLLPLSNYLVTKNEQKKLTMSYIEKTKLSGQRNVLFKTHFPFFIGFILNQFTLLPLYFIQKLYSKSEKSLVLYFEAQPKAF